MRTPDFQRLSESPLLGLKAVPWARPRQVVKGHSTAADEMEVRPTIMHPCVVQARPLSEAAPARYLMYYAPHHSSGIGAAAAQELTGPWKPLADNPILRLEQFTAIHDHLSGPDVVWVPEEGRFRMYFHGVVPGEGQQAGVAISEDGVHFQPLRSGPVLPYPYLRVFRRGQAWYGVCRLGPIWALCARRTGWSGKSGWAGCCWRLARSRGSRTACATTACTSRAAAFTSTTARIATPGCGWRPSDWP